MVGFDETRRKRAIGRDCIEVYSQYVEILKAELKTVVFLVMISWFTRNYINGQY